LRHFSNYRQIQFCVVGFWAQPPQGRNVYHRTIVVCNCALSKLREPLQQSGASNQHIVIVTLEIAVCVVAVLILSTIYAKWLTGNDKMKSGIFGILSVYNDNK